MRYVLILVLLLSGCAIPVKMEMVNKPDPLQQARFEYEKEINLRDRMDKKRLSGYNRIQKLRNSRMAKKELLRQEKGLILRSFKDSGIILNSFEKIGYSMFDIAVFLNEYGKSDINGFCDFLETKYPFNTWAMWALDKEVFIPAKRNHELLRRLNEK